jgi:hypothetical protein
LIQSGGFVFRYFRSALNIASGDKEYIEGACVLSASAKIVSSFDTRDADRAGQK